MDPLGLQHRATEWSERYWGWLGRDYVPGPTAPVQLLSSQLLLSGAAVGLDRLLPGDGGFDIRVQGALHLVLYLARPRADPAGRAHLRRARRGR